MILFHPSWSNILIKFKGCVDVTSVKVFVKFGYDQSNISCRKATSGWAEASFFLKSHSNSFVTALTER